MADSDPSTIDVRFLGTGDAFSAGGRLQSATLLRSGPRGVLVDCGPTTLAAMRGAGIEPEVVETIILTHLHGDHFAGVPFLIMDAHYASGRTAPLTVAGPPGLATRMQEAHDVLFPGTGALPLRFSLTYVELVARRPADLTTCVVTAFPAAHGTALSCYSLRVEFGGRVVAFSGDTQWTDALLQVSANADLFVCECYGFQTAPPHHLDYRTLMSHQREFTCRRIVLNHMGAEMLRQAPRLEIETASDGLVIRI
ncbi:MAG: MBL fold metallo-hydrolase [Acidobacteriota bacterium]